MTQGQEARTDGDAALGALIVDTLAATVFAATIPPAKWFIKDPDKARLLADIAAALVPALRPLTASARPGSPEPDLRWTLPLRADGMGMFVFDAAGHMVAQIRGWGSLTGTGGMALPEDVAIEIQKARAHAIADAVNARPRQEQLQEALARLLIVIETSPGARETADAVVAAKRLVVPITPAALKADNG